MRHRWYFIATFVLLGAALVVAQRKPVEAAASGQAILSMVADSERELSRMPAKFTRVSDADEIHAGNALAEAMLPAHEKMSADDVTIEAYVQQIGGRIAPFARRKLPYRFHYIPNRDFLNAFALPGGHVFIGAGLIERMETDDELADVLGHEIEHIDHFHCAERLQVEAALRKIPLAQVISIPIEIFQAGYSKEQELEADREGVRLAARRGYSAHGAIRLFETLERLSNYTRAPGSPQEEMSGVAADILSGYFRSHPAPSERIAQIRAMAATEPVLDRPEQAMKIGYIFLAWKSLESVRDEKFAEAAALAARALQMKPDHPAALEALADAKFGSGDQPAGQAAYRALLTQDPAQAAEIAKWAESRAGHFLEQQNYDGAIALTRSLLELQPNEAALLRFLELAQAGKGDAAGASITAQTLRRLYPDAADEASEQASQQAKGHLGAQRFAEAAAMATLSLALKAGNAEALQTLGDAEFAQARFTEAAAAYQQMLNDETSDPAFLRAFADALGSARPVSAATELQSLVASKHLTKLSQSAIDAELAGLSVLTGADARSQSVQQGAAQGTVAPELLTRLGWWAFRARRIKDARTILEQASAIRPADDEIRNELAWVDLEEGKDAQAKFEKVASTPDSILKNSADAGMAIDAWEQKKAGPALTEWQAVRLRNPQWRSASWRTAIYPPHIAQMAGEMEAELDRREVAQRQRSPGVNRR
ncbi:MAG TPA: M48 family metalloprotease [Thermoanaerobaculia bacterium]|jgi:predicted Zn-dependent protease|nr:M48 family metalloprotease [Thermoanaerobaculia bacterium]